MTSTSVYILCFVYLMLLINDAYCTIHDLTDVIDLSNADLIHFQYFKNFPSQNPKTAGQTNLFIEHFQKKKAVLDYFENLFFGNSLFNHQTSITFDPHFGRASRPYFEQKYGRRGERLIAMLGQGYSIHQLRRHGATPKEFGRIYYPR